LDGKFNILDSNTTTCYIPISTPGHPSEGEHDVIMLGLAFMRGFYTVFDL
jgi:hypothetical protein